MSTQLADHAVMSHREFNELNDFEYRPVPVIAVVGFVMALISSGGIFIWLALPLCLLASLISLVAAVSIRRSQGAYTGGRLAWSGFMLGLLFFGTGLAQQIYAYQTEVPEGYQRISFVRDISEKHFVEVQGQLDVHPEVKALTGKQVFLKGFIYPTQQQTGIKSFLLLKDNSQCCFGGKPELTDRIGVVMDGDQGIDYSTGRVSIAGTFELNPQFTGEDDLDPLYMVKAKLCYKSKSDF